VRRLKFEPQRVVLVLSDGTEEPWDPEASRLGPDGAVYARVKEGAPRGPFEAKFTRHAQASLEPVLVEAEPAGSTGPFHASERVGVRIGGRVHAIAAKNARFG
jgi:hypothetical protein